MASTARRDRALFVLGALLLAAYLVQVRLELDWPWLAQVQANKRYQVVSGCVLAAYLAFQWSFTSRRVFDPVSAAFQHKLAGALAPAVLYAHASRFGYGYLLLLSWSYLGTMMIGLLDRPVVKTHAKWLFTAWFLAHVATAMLLVILGGYHAVIALAYE
jgi:hypothetical protein